MEKNFLNITPESGNGNQEVTINAKANISLEDREERLNYSDYVHRDLIFTGSREKLYKHGNSRKN